ncbi:MAG: NAD(P)/FAD-dependent oxidoreductase [Alphaproteobacteria bacterium]|jgi:cyclohexanone monooxygenase|nr:MAG: NAD(P)/FAD-dependent oxidoreductase [Alphaproteobacteria bacterium]
MTQPQVQAKRTETLPKGNFDAVIVGAGFAGLYMLHRLREMGFKARVLEAGSGVGGTWYWNRYPGARCDVESVQYSFQFSDALQQDWDWSERYAAQPELLAYANHVADRFDLRRDIQFNTRVSRASFDETAGRWVIETGDGARVTATHCIMATGCLSSPNMPAFKGLETFAGERYHTGYWPHENIDFTGKRVAMIGTGSSAVQSIPIIAGQAKQLFVFQRTPNYAIPAHNAPLTPQYRRAIKADYAGLRERARKNMTGIDFDYSDAAALETPPDERAREYETRWQRGGLSFLGAYKDLMVDQAANDTAAEFVRAKIREKVRDARVAELLAPKNTIGCKRLCIDIGYYETFNRPNVSLVDVSESGIEAITQQGVKVEGREYKVDAIVFATGFDAMTGALLKIDIRGKGGLSLREKWREGPRTYLGLGMAGFPNLFTITGPGSPSVLTNMLPTIEQHVDWIADCLGYLRDHGLARIEPSEQAEQDWGAHVGELAGRTLRYTCGSWYLGVNIPGKPRVFMPYIGGFPRYIEKCSEVAGKGYEGFLLG